MIKMPVLLGLIITKSGVSPLRPRVGMSNQAAEMQLCLAGGGSGSLLVTPALVSESPRLVGQGGSLWDTLDPGCTELCDAPCLWGVLGQTMDSEVCPEMSPPL